MDGHRSAMGNDLGSFIWKALGDGPLSWSDDMPRFFFVRAEFA